MKQAGLIDGIIEEPLGGAHAHHEDMADILKNVILNTLDELNALSPQERISQRIDKFCAMGVVME